MNEIELNILDRGLYKLDGHTPVPCTMQEFVATIDESRRVAITPVGDGHDCTVSTVFLGIDFHEPPRLFETMVFGRGPEEDNICLRCATYDEAIKQHFAVVDKLNKLFRKKGIEDESTET